MSVPTIRAAADGRVVLSFAVGSVIDTRYLTYAQARDLRFALGRIADGRAESAIYTCIRPNGDSYQGTWNGGRDAAKTFAHDLGGVLETIKARAAA